MQYSAETVQEALMYVLDPVGVMTEPQREAGMPGSARDPRTVNDCYIIMMDLRIALKTCWLLDEENRLAIGAWIQTGTVAGASRLCGLSYDIVRHRLREACRLLADWMNATKREQIEMTEEVYREIRRQFFKENPI